MKTKVFLDDIVNKYIAALESANERILIMSNHIINEDIAIILQLKKEQGVDVWLFLNTEHKNKWSSDLTDSDLEISQIAVNNNLSFPNICFIDENKLLIGSYPLDYGGVQSCLIEISDDSSTLVQFDNSFKTLKNINADNNHVQDKLISRLQLLKDTLLLGDKDISMFQTQKLTDSFSGDSPHLRIFLENLSVLIQAGNYKTAINKIDELIGRNDALMSVTDSDSIVAILSIKSAEIQIYALDGSLSESEKMIHNFERTYNTLLNDSMIRLMNLRIEKLKVEAEKNPLMRSELEEAIEDRKQFLDNLDFTKAEKRYILNKNQDRQLKELFRKASKLCHPDLVAAEQAMDAKEIFDQIKKAYEANDYELLSRIYEKLKSGIFAPKLTKISDIQLLAASLTNLENRRNELQNELIELRTSTSFETIQNIDNWAAYFEDKLAHINTQINQYRDAENKQSLN